MTKFVPAGPPRRDYQMQGLRDMIANRGVHALLFDPGLGKTAVCIDYASLLALKSPTGHAKVLVIAPLAAVDSWVMQMDTYVTSGVGFHAEALGGSIAQRIETLRARGRGDYATGYRRALFTDRREGDRGKITLLSINLDAFASRRQYRGSKLVSDAIVEAVRYYSPDLLIVDESHRIKGASSNTSRTIARLTASSPRRVILTGTVMPTSPMDVWAQWRFLNPEAFSTATASGRRLPMSFGRFKDRYAQLGGWMGKEIIGFKNLDEMQQIMALNATTATKGENLDLPPVTDVEVPVNLSPKERKAYAEMVNQLVSELDGGAKVSAPNRLAQMMRLRQITSGFLPNDSGELVDLGHSKAKVIRSIVEDTLAGERRIVVFAHFKHDVALLAKSLEVKGTTVLTISGDTPSKDRISIRKRFGDKSTSERLVLVAQTRTMSLAVNELVSASHAIFASLPEQRADIAQARARIDRSGQDRPVTIWYALAPGTVDEVMMTSYRNRTNLEQDMLNHIKNQSQT